MNKTLTPDQVAALAPYEEKMATAIRAGYATYPGVQALDLMRQIWAAHTGNTYPYSPSCSTCIMNLLRDIGTLYFEATGKDPRELAPSKTVKISAAPSPRPAEASAAPKPSKTPAKSKKAANAKKVASKAKK
jgi:hypothetical protein